MSFNRIVEHLNKIEYLRLCIVSCCIYLPLSYAFFKGRKEAFCNSVVMTISSGLIDGLRLFACKNAT